MSAHAAVHAHDGHSAGHSSDLNHHPLLTDSNVRLNGSGLLVVSAPYGFESAAEAVLQALVDALETEPGAGCAVTRVAPE